MSDFSFLGYLLFKRNQVVWKDWTKSALGTKGGTKEKVTRYLGAASSWRERTTNERRPPPRGREHRPKAKRPSHCRLRFLTDVNESD
jgi:hypothetical protein